jgi:hypothetical protein
MDEIMRKSEWYQQGFLKGLRHAAEMCQEEADRQKSLDSSM